MKNTKNELTKADLITFARAFKSPSFLFINLVGLISLLGVGEFDVPKLDLLLCLIAGVITGFDFSYLGFIQYVRSAKERGEDIKL
ncbi:hypothetical protein [Dehalococcoides mccartyi]|uniref:Uncharacterized protein n=1 Tax=Dehalococcoides mccartyi TaxID=61435 RepID=A0AB33HR28_9CHLR|nr:hypothetical protein [Dehalococcoides mccartyi]BAS31188.1 hypothetical protein IBK_0113 [Dehalococcoides mccartyi IBARAKI]BAZ96713.1 hypothetical protein DEHALATV1_0085 [Dehalococcoides mccartyi]